MANKKTIKIAVAGRRFKIAPKSGNTWTVTACTIDSPGEDPLVGTIEGAHRNGLRGEARILIEEKWGLT